MIFYEQPRLTYNAMIIYKTNKEKIKSLRKEGIN